MPAMICMRYVTKLTFVPLPSPPISLQIPGPSDYPAPPIKWINEGAGGKFNESKPKTPLQWIELRAGDVPSPQDYPAPKLPGTGGGRFSEARPKSDVEWKIMRAKEVPGPGACKTEDEEGWGRRGSQRVTVCACMLYSSRCDRLL